MLLVVFELLMQHSCVDRSCHVLHDSPYRYKLLTTFTSFDLVILKHLHIKLHVGLFAYYVSIGHTYEFVLGW